VAIVFEDRSVEGPATHVLVVGVGDYPHLPGGASDLKTAYDDGMKQLSSPPASARAFTDWMIGRFSNPDRQLATVELLLSEGDPAYMPPTRDGIQAEEAEAGPATVRAMSDAAVRWKARGDAEPGSLLIFYFCGHGISKGTDFAIVASDFGGDPARPLTGLVDVVRFLGGMQDCGSTDQCYFIDACRTSTESLVEADNYHGDPLVQKLGTVTTGLAQCVYYSTLGGATAHGVKGRPSFYTGALLKALAGVGASNEDGDWRVKTVRLLEALAHMMRNFVDPRTRKVQVPQSGSQVQFELHRIVGDPVLPFLIGFAGHAGSTPPPSVQSVVFRQGGEDIAGYPSAKPPLPRRCEWRPDVFETWLASGDTEVVLSRTGGATATEQHNLQPPGKTLKGR
jgi:hypothetical protein